MEGPLILDRARAAGVELRIEEGRVQFHGKPSTALLAELRESRAEVLAALSRAPLVTEPPRRIAPRGFVTVATCGESRIDGPPHRPISPESVPSGWVYIRSGALTGCYVGPNGELASEPFEAVDPDPRTP